MRLNTRTVAVSTAVLLVAGGAAFAVVNTTASGTTTATTSTTKPVVTLTTEPVAGFDPVNCSGCSDAAVAQAQTLNIFGKNSSQASLKLTTLGKITIDEVVPAVVPGAVPPAACVPADFAVVPNSATFVDGKTSVVVPPGATKMPIGAVRVKFVDNPAEDVDQSGCGGATITLKFGA